MPIKSTCPACGASYNLADELRGKKVRCKHCNEAFTVGAAAAARARAEEPSWEPVEEEFEERTPARAAQAAARRRPRDDEDEEELDRPRRRRPRSKSSGTGMPVGLLVGLIVGGVALLVVAVGVAAWAFLSTKDTTTASSPGPAPQANQGGGAPVPQPANQAPPANQGGAAQAPADQGFPMVLSNGQVFQDLARIGFRVDYKFQNGRPAPGSQYYLTVISPGGDKYQARFGWHELADQGTMTAKGIDPFANMNGTFEMYIEEGGPGLLAGRKRLSNSVKAEGPGGGPRFGGRPGRRGAPPGGGGGGAGAQPNPNVPPPAPPAPQKLDDNTLTQYVSDLKAGDAGRQRLAAGQLGLAEVDPKRQAEVAQALAGLLTAGDGFTRSAGARALGKWGTKDNVPALIKLVDDTDFSVRWAAFEALGKLKDDRAAEPLAKRFKDGTDRGHAARALQQIGPGAQKAVWPYLKDPDLFTRIDAVKTLQVIATKESVPALQEATKDSNGLVAKMAQDALAAASKR